MERIALLGSLTHIRLWLLFSPLFRCAPCKAFTPQLASIYTGARAAQLPFEVVFVSADRDGDAFNAYFAAMPWLAVKYSDADTRKSLNSLFEVSGIPTLVVLDAQGSVITLQGRADIGNRGDAAVAAWVAQSKAASDAAAAAGGSQPPPASSP